MTIYYIPNNTDVQIDGNGADPIRIAWQPHLALALTGDERFEIAIIHPGTGEKLTGHPLPQTVSQGDIDVALLYKYSAVLRCGWLGEPLDLTTAGLRRAVEFFRDGAFARRCRSLGLLSKPDL